MKKFFSIIYSIIVLVFALASCASNNDGNLKNDDSDIIIEDVIVEDTIIEDIIVEDIITEYIIVE